MLTALGRRTVDEGVASLGLAIAILGEMISEGKSDEEISRRLKAYACALSMFTRNRTFTDFSIVPHNKFSLDWRGLLEIARQVYLKMCEWHAAGYDYVSFQYGNTGCRPKRNDDRNDERDGMILMTGQWFTLDKMIAVSCRSGLFEDPILASEEVQ